MQSPALHWFALICQQTPVIRAAMLLEIDPARQRLRESARHGERALMLAPAIEARLQTLGVKAWGDDLPLVEPLANAAAVMHGERRLRNAGALDGQGPLTAGDVSAGPTSQAGQQAHGEPGAKGGGDAATAVAVVPGRPSDGAGSGTEPGRRERHALVATPVRVNGQRIALVTVWFVGTESVMTQAVLGWLRAVGELGDGSAIAGPVGANAGAQSVDDRGSRDAAGSGRQAQADALHQVWRRVQYMESLLETVRRLNVEGDAHGAWQVLLADLASQHQCERVTFGWVRDEAVRVLASSQLAVRQLAREGVPNIETAMAEAVDQQGSVVWPAVDAARDRITIGQAQRARESGAAGVASVPLAIDGRIVGVLMFERDETAFTADDVAGMERAARWLAPVVLVRQRAATPWSAGLAMVSARLVRRVRRRHWFAAAALVAVVVPFIPVPDEVHASARVEAQVQRVLGAPSDGYISRVHVRPGDVVRQGDLLVELDDRDKQIELRRWQAEAEQAERAGTDAIAREDRPQFAQQSARLQQARSHLALVESELKRLAVRAPFDGVVLKGDLTQKLGAPVRAADELMVVAPGSGHRVIVGVDERDIGRVAVGQPGWLRLGALPGRSIALRVVRIPPATVVVDARNVIEVEALPDESVRSSDAANGADALRAGYAGFARLPSERRAIWRIVLEAPWRWISDHLWALGWTRA